jgi:hypothetical protein
MDPQDNVHIEEPGVAFAVRGLITGKKLPLNRIAAITHISETRLREICEGAYPADEEVQDLFLALH